MTRLRKWQEECVANAITHFQNNKHFFCQATPGAGKTIMAAELAARLIKAGKIDFVLCFSPSLAVSEGMRDTFAKRLGARFDGKLGAAGGSFTYQAMNHLADEFWSLLDDHRVMVVLDEIHHCAGLELAIGNVWGQLILGRIQHRAAYTLALSGTPWRSDQLPIVLACYTDEFRRIRPNYTYGLAAAISEGVCRIPKIVLVDNEALQISAEETPTQQFDSIARLLAETRIGYKSVLRNQAAIEYVVELGCDQLHEVRQTVPDAAGLVVTSSVEHAEQVASVLRRRGETTVVVNYQVSDPQGVIRHFQNSRSHWIVSVGMISEGTDIPRLQVCCHLSRIRTELHFRQVLGRILRRRKVGDGKAWLFTFAEPTLSRFAQRVAEDLPDHHPVSHTSLNQGYVSEDSPQGSDCNGLLRTGKPIELKFEEPLMKTGDFSITSGSTEQTLTFAGQYRREVIQIYDSPF